ncbi:MAG: hypothetical protein JW798_07130 [Prolixibacteraceae bacterium]|nr:hypothetical protein [Prolixibacteraceae bacterium]
MLNKEGIVKIDNVIYRFFEGDKLYNETNDLQKLLTIRSKDDYIANEVLVNNGSFPMLKSLTVEAPYSVLSQNHEDGYEVRYDDGPQQSANSEYRIMSKLYYSCLLNDWGYVTANYFCIKNICQKKGLFGIWFNNPDIMYYILHDMVFGGNDANTSGTITHYFLDHHSTQTTSFGNSLSQHYYYFYYCDDDFTIPYSNFLPPVCTESSHQYWNNHVTTRWWMTIHD